MTTRTARSQRATERAVTEAQERHVRLHNARVAQEAAAERKSLAAAEARRSQLHVVR